ncbi:hypothetical protein Bca52824_089394 [Brassica carinata]|uniref:RING-type E3 ubiquitin transferase n=1 Tax=Brassica carinata TaxID=52824 RepID=A0A8X7TQG0_BRACI|nr:hypothetical protein Bca52824_089394 [Brassica carinata]
MNPDSMELHFLHFSKPCFASGKKITELPDEERRLVFNPRGGSVSDSRRARHCVLSVDSQRSTETSNNNLNSPLSLELFSGFPELGLSGSLSGQDSFHTLEERIGTVSTALTEEAISKCLKTSIYQKKPSKYTIGDEVGRLYYLKYVPEWLRMKSWCPICKTTAETSSSK